MAKTWRLSWNPKINILPRLCRGYSLKVTHLLTGTVNKERQISLFIIILPIFEPFSLKERPFHSAVFNVGGTKVVVQQHKRNSTFVLFFFKARGVSEFVVTGHKPVKST